MMEGYANWEALWRELSLRFRQPTRGAGKRKDPWRERAFSFDASVKRRQAEGKDPLVEALVDKLLPTDKVVDIGAGTGRWAIPLAGAATMVTAIEPSAVMVDILKENAAAAGVTNITAVSASWEDTTVEPHDVALSSHSVYASPDLPGFIHKMESLARRVCVLVLRVPRHDGIIGKLSQRIYGQWHDSPNFVIAYNILLGMGIYPDVLMESRVRPWTDDTPEEAFARAKKHLRLRDSDVHDSIIREVLRSELKAQDGGWVWPDGMRSAMIWWKPDKHGPPIPR